MSAQIRESAMATARRVRRPQRGRGGCTCRDRAENRGQRVQRVGRGAYRGPLEWRAAGAEGPTSRRRVPSATVRQSLASQSRVGQGVCSVCLDCVRVEELLLSQLFSTSSLSTGSDEQRGADPRASKGRATSRTQHGSCGPAAAPRSRRHRHARAKTFQTCPSMAMQAP